MESRSNGNCAQECQVFGLSKQQVEDLILACWRLVAVVQALPRTDKTNPVIEAFSKQIAVVSDLLPQTPALLVSTLEQLKWDLVSNDSGMRMVARIDYWNPNLWGMINGLLQLNQYDFWNREAEWDGYNSPQEQENVRLCVEGLPSLHLMRVKGETQMALNLLTGEQIPSGEYLELTIELMAAQTVAAIDPIQEPEEQDELDVTDLVF